MRESERSHASGGPLDWKRGICWQTHHALPTTPLDTESAFAQPCRVPVCRARIGHTNAMDRTKTIKAQLAIAAAGCLLAGCASTQTDADFVPLFDGKTLSGWRLVGKKGDGFSVKDGVIQCARGGGGKLLSDKENEDLILRLEFKLDPGSNNGVGLRVPLEGDPTYLGMEIQILDDNAPQYADLRPAQYCGSIYDVVPARRGALNKAGEWNEEEILCVGRHVK